MLKIYRNLRGTSISEVPHLSSGKTREHHFLKSRCFWSENESAGVTFFAKNGAALPKSNTFVNLRFRRLRLLIEASLAPSACRQSLPKHHVVWNCLGVVVSGFRNMALVRC